MTENAADVVVDLPVHAEESNHTEHAPNLDFLLLEGEIIQLLQRNSLWKVRGRSDPKPVLKKSRNHLTTKLFSKRR